MRTSQPGPDDGLVPESADEVPVGDDPERRFRVIADDDKPMDAVLGHRSCSISEGRRTADGHGGLGHHISNQQGGPVGRRDLGSPEADEVGLADNADETPRLVDDGQPADVVVGQDFGDLDDGGIRGNDNRVARHQVDHERPGVVLVVRHAPKLGHDPDSRRKGA